MINIQPVLATGMVLTNLLGMIWLFTAQFEGLDHSWLTDVGAWPVVVLWMASSNTELCPFSEIARESNHKDRWGAAGGEDLSRARPVDQYFAAVLFAMATMSTAGYGAENYPFLVTNIHKALSVGRGAQLMPVWSRRQASACCCVAWPAAAESNLSVVSAGDIHAKTTLERGVAMLIMLVKVVCHAFHARCRLACGFRCLVVALHLGTVHIAGWRIVFWFCDQRTGSPAGDVQPRRGRQTNLGAAPACFPCMHCPAGE